MAELVIEIPEELKHKTAKFPEINWSDIVREFIRGEVYRLIRLKSIVSKSKFTEKDALEIGRKINKGLAKRYMKLLEDKG